LRVYAHLRTFNPQLAKFSTWLYQIARNTARTQLVRERRRPQTEDLYEDETLEQKLPDQRSESRPEGRLLQSDDERGKPAPDFTLAALSAHIQPALHLASLKGKPLVINFWGSSCAPCAEEAPLLQAAWQRARAQGVVFIGIDYQDTQSDGLSFLQQHGITYLNAIDANGANSINLCVTGTPDTFFIDRRGVVVDTMRSELTAQVFQAKLALLTR
jgi:DsbE subfamily thiol:disulfide oxidoreductase